MIGRAGFPLLILIGQFLLKDVVLASAAITVAVMDAAKYEAKLGVVKQDILYHERNMRV